MLLTAMERAGALGDDERAVSKVLGVILLVAIVLLLSVSVAAMTMSFSERLDAVDPVEVYDEERCATGQVLEFDGDVDRFHAELNDNPCALWFDAGRVHTDGSGRVTEWTDRGPRDSHARQSDPSQRPTLHAAGSGPGGIGRPAVGFENNASMRPGCSPGDHEGDPGCSGGGTSGIRYYDEGRSLSIDRSVDDLGIDEDTGLVVAALVYAESFDRGGTWTIGEAGEPGREFSMRTRGDDATWSSPPLPPEDNWRAQHWRGEDVDFTADSHGEWIVLIHAYDGTETTIRVNGTAVATEPTDLDLSGNRDVQLGRWERTDGDPDFYFDGAIAEVIVFDRAMDDDELTDVEEYFDRRYGVVDA